ncbi:hypothetical protein OS493_005435 [Desmophyllum pertusum]|uniref:Uncharacterized protein n=1 Tax=Desmophyllum pertusum TaxID=174260 RepID=A0A9W9YSD1_9CNID|nr:hypothetical protein OS493_005435 [Desmophyllum pertusum]
MGEGGERQVKQMELVLILLIDENQQPRSQGLSSSRQKLLAGRRDTLGTRLENQLNEVRFKNAGPRINKCRGINLQVAILLTKYCVNWFYRCRSERWFCVKSVNAHFLQHLKP